MLRSWWHADFWCGKSKSKRSVLSCAASVTKMMMMGGLRGRRPPLHAMNNMRVATNANSDNSDRSHKLSVKRDRWPKQDRRRTHQHSNWAGQADKRAVAVCHWGWWSADHREVESGLLRWTDKNDAKIQARQKKFFFLKTLWFWEYSFILFLILLNILNAYLV